MFLPLAPEPDKESSKPSLLIQGKLDFLGELKKGGGGLALILTEFRKEAVHEVPGAVQNLLNKFPEVTTESVG